MSRTTALGIVPDRRPLELAEYSNAWGWAPSIWRRLLIAHGSDEHWINDNLGLTKLWRSIDSLPSWQQAPLVLTFDTGVIPWQEYEWAAEQLVEFEARLPENPGYANHVPAVAELLRSKPEAPFFGVYGTSVSDNPFDPYLLGDEDDIDFEPEYTGLPLSALYLLAQHRHHLSAEAR